MVTRELEIQARTGLPARPAAAVVEAANQFKSKLKLVHANQEANLKSIVSVMSLAVLQEDTIVVQAEGGDEQDAVEQVSKLLKEQLS